MSPPLKVTCLLAPVALAAVVLGVPGAAWRWPLPEQAAPASTLLLVPPASRDYCGRAAFMLYDVTWATACDALGEDSECTLPDEVAAKVNPVFAAEEQRCLAVELQASRPAAR